MTDDTRQQAETAPDPAAAAGRGGRSDVLSPSGTGQALAEKKRLAQALRESREQLKLLSMQSLLAIHILQEGRIVYANQAFAELTGFPLEEILTWSIEDNDQNIHPDFLAFVRDQADKKMRGEQDGIVTRYQYKIIRRDGAIRWVDQYSQTVLYKGRPADMISAIDISERRQAEISLKASEEKFRTLVEKSPFGIVLVGRTGRYKYVNPRFTEIFGYVLDEVPTGRDWFEKAFPDAAYRRAVIDAWCGDLAHIGIGLLRPRTFRVTSRDGSQKDIHFNAVTMENREQLVIFEDITEKAKLEKQLQQSQKFEAIGTLAGGIAHDFNNLLMGIQGRASLIATELSPHHSCQDHLKAIEEYIKSATDLTKQLLGFARGGKYEVKATDINELVLSSASMFGRTRKDIEIHTKLQDPAPVVEADRTQIEQVLLNLYVNAWQAMPEGGSLYLETRILELDDNYCRPHEMVPGSYCRISVTDTGVGMDENTRLRIFDPFFTTKDKGRGTGLGLASAYGIIKNHKGLVSVYSETGHGSTFNIYLPISEKAVQPQPSMETGLSSGSETILLVDDEGMIIDVARAMLEKLGYRVVAADSGQEALEAVSAMGNEIDLVILDMIMPGMDGGTTFDRIQARHPEMPVLLSSGYALNGQADAIMRRGCSGFIQKPFNLAELSRKVRTILDTIQD